MGAPNKILKALGKIGLEKLYETHTLKEIAKICSCNSHATIINHMRKLGIPRRDRDEMWIHGREFSPEWYEQQKSAAQKAEEHPAWKGGAFVDADGYRQVYLGGKYQREHRVVAEAMLKRSLTAYEDVHHKDGNKLNNEPSNLEVVSKTLHHEIHETERDQRDEEI